VTPAAILLVVSAAKMTPPAYRPRCNFLMNGSFVRARLCERVLPTVIRGTAYGSASFFGGIAAAMSPAIIGWIATSHSISPCLPLLAFAFFLIAPLLLLVAKETTPRGLADFIGQEPPASKG
jgi:MFS family permease